jgi:DNA-binding NtrC family response regulator
VCVFRELEAVVDQKHTGSRAVLIAEPDSAIRSLVSRLLADEGYLVLETGNGAKALRLAEEHRGPIDLLLTGSWLPGPNRCELCTQVMYRHPETRVLFVARSEDPELRGRVVFLKKPFSLRELFDSIWGMLDGRETERPRIIRQARNDRDSLPALRNLPFGSHVASITAISFLRDATQR